MIDEFILNNAQGFVGMIIMGYIVIQQLNTINKKLEVHSDSFILLSRRIDRISEIIEYYI